jgi:outer membrane receptor protein involved in Fe transport
MVAFGVFHKDFDRPIQKFVSGTTGGYALRPQNGQDARLSGYEAELRLSFMSLWDLMDWMVDLGEKPTLMARMSLVANYGQVDSKVKLTDSSGNQVEKPLAGQSSYSTNLGVFYGHRKWEAGLLYKTFGRRLFAFGLSAKLPDIYEYPTESLDFSVGYQVSPGVKMRLSADNLLDQALEFRQADKVTQRYKNGTTVGISFRYEPGASE